MVTSGALLVVFMGHGGGELNVSNLEDIVMHNRQPMIAWFACSTGDFISDWESDAEQVFKQPGGPIATLVSSATTHPYANAVNALELENAFFLEQPKTYGEVIMQMKWLSLYNTSDLREMIDEFAPLYMPESEMPDTVDDHMYSYNLLGDPAVQIRFPMGSVSLEAEDGLLGSELQVTGTVDNFSEGTITIQLMCERATILEELVPIDDPMLEDNWPAVQDNWTKANNYSITSIDIPVAGGSFNGIIEIPENIPAGSYHLAAYAENSQQDAAGSMALKVKKDTQ
jgi:acylphosphatase